MIRSTSFEPISGVMGKDRRVAGQGREKDLTPDESERVRAVLQAMRDAESSIAAVKRRLGGFTAVWIGQVLSGQKPVGEKLARKVAEVAGLEDGFWRNKKPRGAVTIPATEDDRVRWVAQQLGFHQADLLKLWRESAAPKRPSAIGDEEMHGLPDHVWAAAMATVHLEDVTIEQAVRAAVIAWAEDKDKLTVGPMPEHWLKAIALRLGGKRRESGSRPRIRLGPRPPEKK